MQDDQMITISGVGNHIRAQLKRLRKNTLLCVLALGVVGFTVLLPANSVFAEGGKYYIECDESETTGNRYIISYWLDGEAPTAGDRSHDVYTAGINGEHDATIYGGTIPCKGTNDVMHLLKSGSLDNAKAFVLLGLTVGNVLSTEVSWSDNDTGALHEVFSGGSAAVSEEETEEESDTEADPCFANAGAVGWVICPVVTLANNALKYVYAWVETNFLATNSTIFTNADNGVEAAWNTMRNVSNIVFVILILVVVISQLSGFGIDNYGIKKILPKLIVVALLVNLSYIICQLAVDLSNVIGYNLKWFLGDAVPLTPAAQSLGVSPSGLQISADIFLGVGVAAAVILISPAIIITLVIFVVTALIAVLFMWIILLVRQVGVILAVILSPLAMICFLLPNTQSLFMRWVKIIRALLLVFPLCSLVIGAGTMGSKILANVGANMPDGQGSMFLLAAIIIQVIPFFFVPVLLKGSLAALGNIGSKLSGVGNSWRKGANKNINNLESVKERRARWNAGVNRKGEATRLGSLRVGIANTALGKRLGVQRRVARNQAAYVKQEQEHIAAENMLSGGFEARMAKLRTDSEREVLENQMALINKNTNKGEDSAALYAEYHAAVESGDIMKARAVAEIAGRRKDTAAEFTQKLRDDMRDGKYTGHEDVLKAISKQMTTGENSKQYRGSDALAYEYASQINRGETSDDYDTWVAQSANVTKAIEHHITNGQELYGQKGSVIDELRTLTAGTASGDYLSELAKRAQEEASKTGVYDQTKQDAMSRLQGFANAGAQNASVQAAQTAKETAEKAEKDRVFDVQRQQLHTTHEQIAAEKGPTAGMFQGRNIYSTPTGFNATSRDTSSGDLILKNARGEKWNAHKGKYVK